MEWNPNELNANICVRPFIENILYTFMIFSESVTGSNFKMWNTL